MNFQSFLRQGELHAWLFVPIAIFMGAIHGLEPDRSKAMIAGFIIAIRGTMLQAILLGLSAAISPSAIIWGLAAVGLKYGSQWDVGAAEPIIQIGTGILIAALALWTLVRLHLSHADHNHHREVKLLSTKSGLIALWIEETHTPPRFQIHNRTVAAISSAVVTTRRPNGSMQVFAMKRTRGAWISINTVPEPHEFHAEATLRTADGQISGEAVFEEHAAHTDDGTERYDAHARAHAEEIRRRFEGRAVTTPQILLFGLTGGLMPCPAALSILLVCLQLKRAVLGFTLVAAFGVGLAITMVSVGVAASWSAKRISSGNGRLAHFARNAPYLSSALLLLLAVCVIARGAYGMR